MIVCIDSGNTRVKWAVHDGRTWLDRGSVDHACLDELAVLPLRWPTPERVMVANVAGDGVAERLKQVLDAWTGCWQLASSSRQCCGITNFYQQPERLGIDRWCALVGARSLTSEAVVVVMAGTATTIDTLDGEGRFLGGLIMPGIDAMRRALAHGTASLPLARGERVDYPCCTDDAIMSGIIEAHLGAIERAYGRLACAAKACLISGGNADVLAKHLVIPAVVVENLPIEGLKEMARQQA